MVILEAQFDFGYLKDVSKQTQNVLGKWYAENVK